MEELATRDQGQKNTYFPPPLTREPLSCLAREWSGMLLLLLSGNTLSASLLVGPGDAAAPPVSGHWSRIFPLTKYSFLNYSYLHIKCCHYSILQVCFMMYSNNQERPICNKSLFQHPTLSSPFWPLKKKKK